MRVGTRQTIASISTDTLSLTISQSRYLTPFQGLGILIDSTLPMKNVISQLSKSYTRLMQA